MKPVVVAVVILLFVGTALTQKKRTSARKPTIKATVTIKGDGNFPPPPRLAEENEAGLWNEFRLEKHRARILFPAKPGDVESISIADGKTYSYEAYTANASYKLVVIAHDPPIDDVTAARAIEKLINALSSKPGHKIVERRAVSYAGRRGVQIVEESSRSVVISRVLPLNGALFCAYAVIEDKSKRRVVEPWINKFLDSLQVEVTPLVEGE
ncbi:MAG TPA: hypothetical protein VNA22_10440 [Pyrinomonadaceae bacterium]|nr:hypothetical protein [Pyrinomonadaceae bacterium]